MDRVEVLDFSRAFAALTAREYLQLLKDRFGVATLLMGYDNRIGSNRLTAPELVSPAGVVGMELIQTEAFGKISSTMVRKSLEQGKVEEANGMLGYRYGLQGVVVAGNRLGRTIGFPTANMKLYEPLKLVPGMGVYVVEVEVLGKKYRGMTNIGLRPTVGGSSTTIETHILDFDEDIYGLPLRIAFLRRLRDEVHFPSLAALKEQLERDREACRA